MKTTWKAEAPSLVVLAVMFGLSTWAWPHSAHRIATHFNAAGDADGYGGRFAGLVLVPLGAALIYVLSVVWPHLDPRGESFGFFTRAYSLVRGGVMALFLVIHATIVAQAIGRPIDRVATMSLAGGVLFVLLGNYLPKIEPNWFIGVRTPWTLSSDLSWHKTHRFAGPLLVIAGFITIAVSFARPHDATRVMLGLLVSTALAASAYSYVIWRKDPGRRRPGGRARLIG